jgi:cytochrome b
VAATRVWDFPVRLVHWLIIPLIAFSWWTAEEGPGLPAAMKASLEASSEFGFIPWMEWHRWSGFAILGLILFRILWGFLGSETARFSRFVRGPAAVAAYVGKLFSKSSDVVVGHNPLGGWSVLALVLLIAAQTALGLFAVDVDGLESGPLAVFVSFDQGRVAAALHEIVFNLLLAFIALHVLAILFYAVFKRDNLIGPMITGKRTLREGAAPPAMAPIALALLCAALAAGFVYAVLKAFWLH